MIKKIIVAFIVIVVAGYGIYSYITYKNPYESANIFTRARFKHVILPVQTNTHFRITQGAFGCCTHNKKGLEYAWDFDVPDGTPLLSIEDGKVILVVEPDKGGGCDHQFDKLSHYLQILNGDGSVSQYAHIKSRVKKGDHVKKGQIIAVSADNGFHCTPQFQFNVFKNQLHLPQNNKAETIPLLFEGLPEGGIARELLVH